MRRLPVAVLFNRYPLILEVLEPILRERLTIAAWATDTAEAATLVDTHEPDLLIAGVETEGEQENIFELVRSAVTKHPRLKVIAFSSSADRTLLADAFDAGVSAFIHRTRPRTTSRSRSGRRRTHRSTSPPPGSHSRRRRILWSPEAS